MAWPLVVMPAPSWPRQAGRGGVCGGAFGHSQDARGELRLRRAGEEHRAHGERVLRVTITSRPRARRSARRDDVVTPTGLAKRATPRGRLAEQRRLAGGRRGTTAQESSRGCSGGILAGRVFEGSRPYGEQSLDRLRVVREEEGGLGEGSVNRRRQGGGYGTAGRAWGEEGKRGGLVESWDGDVLAGGGCDVVTRSEYVRVNSAGRVHEGQCGRARRCDRGPYEPVHDGYLRQLLRQAPDLALGVRFFRLPALPYFVH
eukprot:7733856-Pyramimonas_sp.AAC.1